MDIRALNAGEAQIWHCQGCVCGNGTGFTVLAPNGAPVALKDPRHPQCLAVDTSAPLPPGGVLGNGGRFTGVLYVMDSPIEPTPTYAALPGTYTVVASFSYATSPMSAMSAPIGITRVATFVWKP
jgi:hypothetical protein